MSMHRHRPRSSHHGASRIVFGLGVIGIGLLALLDNLNVFGVPLLRTFWPLIFVWLGVTRLIRPCHSGSGLLGVGLILLGGLLTARNLGYADFNLREWWPVFIILVGLSILARGLFPRHRRPAGFQSSTLEHGERVNIDASFSAISQRCDSRSFKGGRIASTFGGVELDLTQATIDGDEAQLEVSAHFSGIDLRVPREWLVVIEATSTFGGVEDKTVPPMTPGPRLVLRGEVMFGGVEVKN